MTAADIRGWCPSLHEPMAAADGLIVRVKPRVGGLSSEDLRRIASAADEACAGGLDLTARGALQVRGLSSKGATRFGREMVEADLASADAAVERRRNLQIGVGCGPNLLAVATALETWLENDAGLSVLPAKFGFGVSTDENVAADIVVVGEDGRRISLGGRVGAAPHESATALDAVQRLTEAFIRLSLRQARPPRRMQALIDGVGADVVLAQAGLSAAPAPARGVGRTDVGPRHGGFGLGVVFGVLTPSDLRAAARIAERLGDGRIRLAPSRVIWVQGVAPADEGRLAADAAAAGFIVDAHDPRLRLDACVGRAGCLRASEDVRSAALSLTGAAPATGLHVSGCVKGCAHPGVAGVTLVSRGRPGRYDLILDGGPSAPAMYADLRLDDVTAYLSQVRP